MRSLWLSLCAVWFAALTAEAVTVVSQSQIRERFDDKITLRNHAQFVCSDTSPEGRFTIDDAELTIPCEAQEYRYVQQEIGRIPADVVNHNQYFCIASNPAAMNATLRMRVAALSQGSPIARRLLGMPDISDATVSAFHRIRAVSTKRAKEMVGASRRLLNLLSDIGDALGFDISEDDTDSGPCGGQATPWDRYVTDLFDPSNSRIAGKLDCLGEIYGDFAEYRNMFNQLASNVSTALLLQADWNQLQEANIDRIVQQNNITARSLETLALGQITMANDVLSITDRLDQFANDTQRKFIAARAGLESFQNMTATRIDGLSGSLAEVDFKYGNRTTDLYNRVIAVMDQSRESFFDVHKRIEDLSQRMTDAIDTIWSNMKNVRINSELNEMFFTELVLALDEGRLPAVGLDFYIPQRSPTGYDESSRVLYEQFHVNFLRNVTDGDGIKRPRIEHWAIKFYGWRRALQYGMENQFDLLRLIHLIGPGNCRRPVVKTRAGTYRNETDDSTISSKCVMWIEMERTYCEAPLANRDTVNWASMSPGDSTQQSTLFNSTQCGASAVIQEEPVAFRLFGDFRRYLRDNICSASLWSQSNTNQSATFQMSALVYDKLLYVPQNRDICGHDIFDRTYNTDIESLMFAVLQTRSLSEAMSYRLKLAQLLHDGARPSGITYTDVPFVSLTPPEGLSGDDVYTYADSRIERCVYMQWVSMTSETLPVYSWTPLVGNFEVTNIPATITPLARTQYDVQVESTNAGSSEYASFLKQSYIVVGDLGRRIGANYVYSTDYYDVPSSQMDVNGPSAARRDSVAYWLFPKENVTLTEDIYNTFKAINNEYVEPQYGTVSASSYRYSRALGADGFPYCVLPGDIGVPINSTHPIPASQNPSGDLCGLMRYFQLSETPNFQPGMDLIRALPRKWTIEGKVSWLNGQFTNLDGISNCTDAQLSRLGTAGWNVRLQNSAFDLVDQRIAITSLDGNCDDDFVVTVPANAPLDVTIPACSNLTIAISRRTNVTGVWVPCVSYTTGDVYQTVNNAIAVSQSSTTVKVSGDHTYAMASQITHGIMSVVLDYAYATSASLLDAEVEREQLIAVRDSWTATDVPAPFQLTDFSNLTTDPTGFYPLMRNLSMRVATNNRNLNEAAQTVIAGAQEIYRLNDEIIAANNEAKNITVDLIALAKVIGGLQIKGGGWSFGPRPSAQLFMAPGYMDLSSFDSIIESFKSCLRFPTIDPFATLLGSGPTAGDYVEAVVLIPFRLSLWFGSGFLSIYPLFWFLKKVAATGCCGAFCSCCLSCNGRFETGKKLANSFINLARPNVPMTTNELARPPAYNPYGPGSTQELQPMKGIRDGTASMLYMNDARADFKDY